MKLKTVIDIKIDNCHFIRINHQFQFNQEFTKELPKRLIARISNMTCQIANKNSSLAHHDINLAHQTMLTIILIHHMQQCSQLEVVTDNTFLEIQSHISFIHISWLHTSFIQQFSSASSELLQTGSIENNILHATSLNL